MKIWENNLRWNEFHWFAAAAQALSTVQAIWLTLHMKQQNPNPTGNKYEATTASERPISRSPHEIPWSNWSLQASFWCSPKYSTLLTVQPAARMAAEGGRDPSQGGLEAKRLSIYVRGLKAQLWMSPCLCGADLGNLPSITNENAKCPPRHLTSCVISRRTYQNGKE